MEYGDVHEVAYTYGTSGLRSAGSYVLGEEPEPGSLSLDYDVVGNLTNVSVETPSGARSSSNVRVGHEQSTYTLDEPAAAGPGF